MVQCAPIRSGGGTRRFTCFTKKELEDAADKLKIDTSDIRTTKELYEQILNKIKSRKLSDVDIMEHPKLKTLFDRYTILKPPMPGRLLSNFDIRYVLNQYEEKFPEFCSYGAVPYDFFSGSFTHCEDCNDLRKLDLQRLYDDNIRCAAMIINLDKDGKPGTHWVALFIKLTSPKSAKVYYFDSLGTKKPRYGIRSTENNIPLEIQKFVDYLENQVRKNGGNFEFIANKEQYQKLNSECGMYGLYYIINMIKGNKFTDNGEPLPDKMMTALRHAIFLSPYYCWKCRKYNFPPKMTEEFRKAFNEAR